MLKKMKEIKITRDDKTKRLSITIIRQRPKIVLLILVFLLAILFVICIIRAFSEKQLDDVSPGIPCDSDLLEKSDVFYVIPKFENKSIADNKTWCAEILAMNKTLALHGVYHTYEEFKETRDDEYLEEGIEIFKKCFGKGPDRFKPPQMAFSDKNAKLIKSKMQLDMKVNSILHKAYHCSDTGYFSNLFMDIF
jgi:hypothetical protein